VQPETGNCRHRGPNYRRNEGTARTASSSPVPRFRLRSWQPRRQLRAQ
jgi:hypothetical protein